MISQSEKDACRALAFCLFKDVQRYILEHQDEYDEWVKKEQEASEQGEG